MESSFSPPSNGKLNYYYLFFGFVLVSIVLLIISAITMGCCTRLRCQFLLARRLLGHEPNDLEMQRWIPMFNYHKKEVGVGEEEEEEEAAPECVICLSSFEEGEEVRQLPSCGHAFHAACIDYWFNSHNSCPICRSIILPAMLHYVDVSGQLPSL